MKKQTLQQMERFRVVACTVLLSIGCTAIGYGAEAATVDIDETRVLRPVATQLFGFNHNWKWCQDYLKDPQEFIAVTKGLPLPLLLGMSGTESQYFRWNTRIGSLPQRTPYRAHSEPKATVKAVGLVEWISGCLATDPRAEFTWTFNCYQEQPQDHADLAEFLTGDPARDVNGGTNWAAMRVQCGLPNPVPVVIWEIGNELDHGGLFKDRLPNVNAYIAYCRRTIAAGAHRPATGALRGICRHRSSGKCRNKQGRLEIVARAVLREIGQDIDYVAFHPYYLGMAISTMEQYLDAISAQTFTQSRASGESNSDISEHAMWPPSSNDPKNRFKLGYMTHAWKGCLATARFLNRMMQRSDVAACAYHCMMGGPWNVDSSQTTNRGNCIRPESPNCSRLLGDAQR